MLPMINQAVTTYLFSLATISVTFVGLSAVVVFLRQSHGGAMSALEQLITRIFIQLGFIVVAASLVPPLLALFPFDGPVIWRTSSVFPVIPLLIFALSYPARRRKASGMRTPWGVWLDVFIIVGAALALGANALYFRVEVAPAIYAAALTIVLFIAGWAYLQALETVLAYHAKPAIASNQPS